MKTPSATYRIQLNAEFNFVTASSWLHYLKTLGISTVYVSPIMQATRGSSHGYDVVNTNQINEQLGGDAGWAIFQEELHRVGLDLLVDFVPNHMAASEENAWWHDVTVNHERSPFHHFFDIYSDHPLRYRHFFDINELVSLRMEDRAVFTATHQRILECIADGTIQGLRIDHIDGLINPAGYLQTLQEKIHTPFYLIVEKILAFHEQLPADWPIAGTTGYDFMNQSYAVFLEPHGLRDIVTSYNKITDNKKNVIALRHDTNKKVLLLLFDAELNRLLNSLLTLAQLLKMPVSAESLQKFLIDFTAALPVYRTYIHYDHFSDADQTIVAEALQTAHRYHPDADTALQLLQRVFYLAKYQPPLDETKACLDWISQWQVLTGPVMAKGFEDTTHYAYTPLLSLNEVGSDPHFFLAEDRLADFHTYLQYKAQHYPFSLNATSTHDTKRSEDIRARLNVLSELAEEWLLHFSRWQQQNHDKKKSIANQLAPNAQEEWFIYQTLLSAFPLHAEEIPEFRTRMTQYLIKSLREAKIHSFWQQPNSAYEQAVTAFCTALLDPVDNTFLADFRPFQQKISFYGMLNSLAQLILKITCPGIPDFYQGNELWHFALVDPDNRQRVDFNRPQELIQEFINLNHPQLGDFFQSLLSTWQDGRIKLYLTYRLLNYRRAFTPLFLQGDYRPVIVTGKNAPCVLAFIRQYQAQWLLVVVPRWYTTLLPEGQLGMKKEIWQDTQLALPPDAPKQWQSILIEASYHVGPASGNTLPLATLLAELPFNILQIVKLSAQSQFHD